MFREVLLAITVLAGVATSNEHCKVSSTDCSLPFLKLGKRLYYFHTSSKETWNDAFHWCQNNRMQLLTIEDKIEDNLISRAISDTEMYWTSGNDLEVEGRFVWRPSGQALNHTNWAPGEPCCKELQNCVLMGRWDGAKNVNWHDAPCHWKHHFICEAPPPSF